MNTKLTRAAAAVGGLAITAAFAVSCAETKDAAKDMASSAASAGSSAASAADHRLRAFLREHATRAP